MRFGSRRVIALDPEKVPHSDTRFEAAVLPQLAVYAPTRAMKGFKNADGLSGTFFQGSIAA